MKKPRPQTPSNRLGSYSDSFKDFITRGWAPYPSDPRPPLVAHEHARRRCQELSAQFPHDRLIIPAGGYKVRSNDCDYRYRAHSGFAYLSGLGNETEPDSVLVIEDGTPTLFFHGRVERSDPEFYSSSQYGEMWVGSRPSIEDMVSYTQMVVKDSSQLSPAIASPLQHSDGQRRILPGVDSRLDALVGAMASHCREADRELNQYLSEMRLIKDAYEVGEMEKACAATLVGFEAVIAELPKAVAHGRGERWVEGVFGLHARHLGNAVGYDTIVASGDHANTLHWINNDGDLHDGDLLLMDAGVEVNSLYTADVTRTLPVSGVFSPAQRQVYNAVLEAQQAGMDAARPGAKFLDVHRAAVRVLAEYLHDWGILDVSVEETLKKSGGEYKRWMVHGTSHHLGIDVHDCAQARRKLYRGGKLREGMIITVEPGLYFKSTDLMVPEELRGIGVRIEDDILITKDGYRNLSEAFPRNPGDVEAWIDRIQHPSRNNSA